VVVAKTKYLRQSFAIGNPTVTLGLPVLNERRWIERTVTGVLQQEFTDWELIISDAGSTDGTAQFLAAHVARNGKMMGLYAKEPQGMIDNWNRPLGHAQGRFYAWIGGHDLRRPQWLHILLNELIDHPEAVLVYSGVDKIDAQNQVIQRHKTWPGTKGLASPWERGLHASRHLAGFGDMVYGLFRIDALQKVGGFPKTMSPDTVMLQRLSLEGEFRPIDKALWARRYIEMPSAHADWQIERPLKRIFTGRRPLLAFFPTLQHVVHMFLRFPLPYGPVMAAIWLKRFRVRALQEAQWRFIKLTGWGTHVYRD
jgi:glycosyltransferase involved in cell wall biosynthesis